MQDKINLIVIYISEAHANDEWAISNKYKINQHKNIEERITAANYLTKEKNLNISIYADSIGEDSFEKIYKGFPERGFIFQNNIITHISYVRIDDLIRWYEEIDEWFIKNNYY